LEFSSLNQVYPNFFAHFKSILGTLMKPKKSSIEASVEALKKIFPTAIKTFPLMQQLLTKAWFIDKLEGGCSGTFLCANLAAELAVLGSRVLVISGDPNRNIEMTLANYLAEYNPNRVEDLTSPTRHTTFRDFIFYSKASIELANLMKIIGHPDTWPEFMNDYFIAHHDILSFKKQTSPLTKKNIDELINRIAQHAQLKSKADIRVLEAFISTAYENLGRDISIINYTHRDGNYDHFDALFLLEMLFIRFAQELNQFDYILIDASDQLIYPLLINNHLSILSYYSLKHTATINTIQQREKELRANKLKLNPLPSNHFLLLNAHEEAAQKLNTPDNIASIEKLYQTNIKPRSFASFSTPFNREVFFKPGIIPIINAPGFKLQEDPLNISGALQNLALAFHNFAQNVPKKGNN
ncbi:hypothetical protein OAR19_00785, partial [bacterium]|nr:hypothetical protein [bacterium]